jgi:gluconolactonase
MQRMQRFHSARAASVTALSGVLGVTCVALGACATAPAAGSATALTSDAFPGVGTPAALPGGVAFESLEGPYWIAAKGALVFSDVVEANGPGARIHRYDPAARTYVPLPYPTSAPTSTNGLAVDPQGRLIACERYNARVVRIEANGQATVLAERWPVTEGLPLGAPNDLSVRGDGNIYFTDSDWGARPGVTHAPMGVYRISPAGELSRVLELEKPNGIALAPDGSKLYVGSDVQAKVWSFPVDATGNVGAPTLLIDGPTVPGGFKVPDGICVDDTGNLYIANNDDAIKAILVFDPAGHGLGRIPIPFRPSNCSFGGADRRTLYVTTLHTVYEVRMPAPGLP